MGAPEFTEIHPTTNPDCCSEESRVGDPASLSAQGGPWGLRAAQAVGRGQCLEQSEGLDHSLCFLFLGENPQFSCAG